MDRRLLILWFTIFIDLIGFGIVVPLTPLFGKHFGAHGFVIGLIIASFSAMQFLFAPVWGRLSDRIGRRPVLLFSTAGAAGSYVLFALACGLENHLAALWMIVLARVFAGICGANITVAQAYIADITPPEKRAQSFGIVGSAFGLGFVIGPAIGGIAGEFDLHALVHLRIGVDVSGGRGGGIGGGAHRMAGMALHRALGMGGARPLEG